MLWLLMYFYIYLLSLFDLELNDIPIAPLLIAPSNALTVDSDKTLLMAKMKTTHTRRNTAKIFSSMSGGKMNLISPVVLRLAKTKTTNIIVKHTNGIAINVVKKIQSLINCKILV